MRVNEFFDQRIAKHLLIKKLHKRYQKEGIKIPFPIRDVYVQGDGTQNGAMTLQWLEQNWELRTQNTEESNRRGAEDTEESEFERYFA